MDFRDTCSLSHCDKLKETGLIKGMKSVPKEEERSMGIVPVSHLKEIEHAMRFGGCQEIVFGGAGAKAS